MNSKWSWPKSMAFLFLFVYIILWSNSSQFLFTFLLEPLWQKVIPWFASLVGHPTEISIFTNGSGDTTYNYYQVLFFAIVALIVDTGITFLDRYRDNYETLLRWLTVFIRYYLAAQLINYGLVKMFYLQFTAPSAYRLEQPLGEFSPMGLLWTFMGFSKGYTIFTGAAEFIAGLLLLSRRTTTLGALASFGVMVNVMFLNYCYDVPVKLLSTHMVFLSLFLIAQDGKRLIQLFITNPVSYTHLTLPTKRIV